MFCIVSKPEMTEKMLYLFHSCSKIFAVTKKLHPKILLFPTKLFSFLKLFYFERERGWNIGKLASGNLNCFKNGFHLRFMIPSIDKMSGGKITPR